MFKYNSIHFIWFHFLSCYSIPLARPTNQWLITLLKFSCLNGSCCASSKEWKSERTDEEKNAVAFNVSHKLSLNFRIKRIGAMTSRFLDDFSFQLLSAIEYHHYTTFFLTLSFSLFLSPPFHRTKNDNSTFSHFQIKYWYYIYQITVNWR